MSDEVEAKAEEMPTDLDGLTKALRFEQAKNQVLLNEVVALEDAVVNRAMADFDAVVSDETREFWREQLLTNRDAATKALTELAQAKAAVNSGATAVRRPLHNRATSRPIVPGVASGGEGQDVGGVSDERAARIRNRAHEISRADRVPFSAAFRRAERDVAGQ